jgi:hypothetical protein
MTLTGLEEGFAHIWFWWPPHFDQENSLVVILWPNDLAWAFPAVHGASLKILKSSTWFSWIEIFRLFLNQNMESYTLPWVLVGYCRVLTCYRVMGTIWTTYFQWWVPCPTVGSGCHGMVTRKFGCGLKNCIRLAPDTSFSLYLRMMH